ncbi:diguanylate cyclase [Pontibacter sp. JAM-7]|uniref:diguanylate cyclase n=1 Tax=Pontibacter sp. JAM-7 TaxID=3366581 RepID=UPI003AF8BB40
MLENDDAITNALLGLAKVTGVPRTTKSDDGFDGVGFAVKSLLHSPLPLLVTDERLCICYANQAATSIINLLRGQREQSILSLGKCIASPYGDFIRWLQGDSASGLEIRLMITHPNDFVVYKHAFEYAGKLYYALAFCSRDNLLFLNRELNIYQAAFKYARQAIFITDGNGIVISVNPGFCELSGLADREVVGRSMEQLFNRSDMLQRAINDTLVDATFWEGRVLVRDLTGQHIHAQLKVVDADPEATNPDEAVRICILENIEAQMARENALKRSAETDSLTGLYNRAGFDRYFMESFSEAQRTGEGLTLLFADLDNFKALNDNFGHALGDQVLVHVSQRLQHNLKKADFIARIGGDEFVVVLNGSLSDTAKNIVASKLVTSLGLPYLLQGTTYHCSVSIGISSYPDDAIHAKALMNTADQAMYQAKESGRNQFCVYQTASQADDLSSDASVALALPDNAGLDQLSLRFSPYYAIGSQQVAGALVSLQPQATLNSALPEGAESTEMTMLKLSELFAYFDRKAADIVRLPLTIAVKPAHLMAPDVVRFMKAKQQTYPDLVELIWLQLTAQDIRDAQPDLIAQLGYLSGLGYGLAVEGIGESLSLHSWLSELNFNLAILSSDICQPGDALTATVQTWRAALCSFLHHMNSRMLVATGTDMAGNELAEWGVDYWYQALTPASVDTEAYIALLTQQSS